MEIKKKEEKRFFLLNLIRIRRDETRTLDYTDDVFLTPKDIKDIILKRRSIFKVWGVSKGKDKVREILSSIAENWEFTHKHNIQDNKLSYIDLPDGNIQIKGYQTEILELYLDDYLGGREKEEAKTGPDTPKKFKYARTFKIVGGYLYFQKERIPTKRGQGIMAKLFIDNRKEEKGEIILRRGKLLTKEFLMRECGHKTLDSTYGGIKDLRKKLRKNKEWMTNIENVEEKVFQMVIKKS